MVNLTLLKEKAKKFAEDQKDTFYEKGVFVSEESTLIFLLKLYEYKKNNN